MASSVTTQLSISSSNATSDILSIVVNKTLATKEQVAQITAMLQEMNEDLDWYIAVQDFDYDGVLNAFDKCPDTPITQINEVNADGCAPGETPVSDD